MIKLDSSKDYELIHFFKEFIEYYSEENGRNTSIDFSGREFMDAICEYGVNDFGLLTEEVFRYLGIIDIRNLDDKLRYFSDKGLIPKVKGLRKFPRGYLSRVLNPSNINMVFIQDGESNRLTTKYKMLR